MTTQKPSFQSLSGKLLLAMPGMADTRFTKRVIFVCAHDPGGAMGLVINAVLPHISMGALLEQLEVTGGQNFADVPVLEGGPVDKGRGFLLHSTEALRQETIRIDNDFAVTGTIDALRDMVSGNGPAEKIFALGYAGWGAGQLEAEIADNAWLIADADADLVFKTPLEDKWQAAMQKTGIDPRFLVGVAGHA